MFRILIFALGIWIIYRTFFSRNSHGNSQENMNKEGDVVIHYDKSQKESQGKTKKGQYVDFEDVIE